MNTIDRLKELYANESKHSNYQILSSRLCSIIGAEDIYVKSRCERERFDYILSKVSVDKKNILDIGGNTGFFTFEMLEKGAEKIHYYDGNKKHSEFVQEASTLMGHVDKIVVTDNYYTFEQKGTSKYDIVLLLNVLHHLGDDYGCSTISIDDAKNQIISQLNSISLITNYIAFQLGFCWKGDRDVGLFENGTKKELIDFVKKSTDGFWETMNIGIPVQRDGVISYKDLDKVNIARDDHLGEFLNRPLFIMKSLATPD